MLKKFFKTIDRVFLFIEEWSLFLTVSVALMVAMANVIVRKLPLGYFGIDISLYWSDEVVRKTIYFTTYIGCVAAVRSRALIRIDALPQLFPVTRRFLTLVNHLVVLAFSGAIIWLGWGMTRMMYQDEYARTASLQIPEWTFYTILPLMGVMMFLRTLIVMVEDWRGVNMITDPETAGGQDEVD